MVFKRDEFDKHLKAVDAGYRTPCLEWQGSRIPQGYGHIRINPKKTMRTHRFAWIRGNGEIPPGIDVLHHCDNPPCCRLDHLFLGTDIDNVRDRKSKGRPAGEINWGEKHPFAKLTASQVIEARLKYQNGGITVTSLAKENGVSLSGMYSAIRGITWKGL